MANNKTNILRKSNLRQSQHYGLLRLCQKKKIKNADIARCFGRSEHWVVEIMRDPFTLNVRCIIMLASILSVTPEYLQFVILHHDYQNTPAKIMETIANMVTKYEI